MSIDFSSVLNGLKSKLNELNSMSIYSNLSSSQHKKNPPIIHIDLKPSNILITLGIEGRFVKLAGFGLEKMYEFDQQSHTEGVSSPKYGTRTLFQI